jgi:hypothetical protein
MILMHLIDALAETSAKDGFAKDGFISFGRVGRLVENNEFE